MEKVEGTKAIKHNNSIGWPPWRTSGMFDPPLSKGIPQLIIFSQKSGPVMEFSLGEFLVCTVLQIHLFLLLGLSLWGHTCAPPRRLLRKRTANTLYWLNNLANLLFPPGCCVVLRPWRTKKLFWSALLSEVHSPYPMGPWTNIGLPPRPITKKI